MTQSPLPAAPVPGDRLTVETVLRLQTVHDDPAVSLLLTTTPSGRLQTPDADRLRALARQAEQRLRAEPDLAEPDLLVDEMHRLVTEATLAPADRAAAVYVARSFSARMTLPVEVVDRAVVDPTFATRDLVRALHRMPRHVVLLLSTKDARLLDGVGGTLRPSIGGAFPLTAAPVERRNPSKDSLATADLTAFMRTVDQALGAYLRLHPAPVVLVGPAKVLAAFRAVSKVARLAGSVAGNLGNLPTDEIAARTRPVLEDYLRSREQEALDLLERRTGEQRVASGMGEAWWAARRARPEMLAVEEGFFYPAMLSEDGAHLTPVDDPTAPDVLDDAVDELVEMVMERGGWVALVADGGLSQHARVALTVQRD